MGLLPSKRNFRVETGQNGQQTTFKKRGTVHPHPPPSAPLLESSLLATLACLNAETFFLGRRCPPIFFFIPLLGGACAPHIVKDKSFLGMASGKRTKRKLPYAFSVASPPEGVCGSGGAVKILILGKSEPC